jgi:glucan phosphoethanolaminetransferase (alkaline phosphatase superfamily)
VVFWITILGGAIFAWFAIKIGFYEIWALLFNILISVYLAIYLTPIVTDILPATLDTNYGTTLTIIALAAAVFLILYGITYILFTGQFKVPFPKIFDILFAGSLGFLTGFLVLSFIVLLICVTPISQNEFLNEMGLNREAQQANISYLCWWCDKVNWFAASKDNKITGQQAIDKLLAKAKPPAPASPQVQAEAHRRTNQEDKPNKPGQPVPSAGSETDRRT